jgi:hypothetical protein
MSIFLLSPSFFSFLAAISVSISVNIITGLLMAVPIPLRWNLFLLSSILFFVSAAGLLRISLSLEKTRERASGDDLIDDLRSQRARLIGFLILSIGTFLIGIGFLAATRLP